MLALVGGSFAACGLIAWRRRPDSRTAVWCDWPQRLSQQLELAAYFVAAEALTNVAKYSEASHATVRAWIRDGRATVEVADDRDRWRGR